MVSEGACTNASLTLHGHETVDYPPSEVRVIEQGCDIFSRAGTSKARGGIGVQILETQLSQSYPNSFCQRHTYPTWEPPPVFEKIGATKNVVLLCDRSHSYDTSRGGV